MQCWRRGQQRGRVPGVLVTCPVRKVVKDEDGVQREPLRARRSAKRRGQAAI